MSSVVLWEEFLKFLFEFFIDIYIYRERERNVIEFHMLILYPVVLPYLFISSNNSKLVVGKKVTLAIIPTKLLRHLSGFQGIFEVTLAADIVSDSCRKAVVAKTPGQGQSSQVFTSFRFEILNYPNRCANYTSRKADGGQRKNGLCRREMNIGYEHRTNHVNTCPSNFLFCIIIITIIFIIII